MSRARSLSDNYNNDMAKIKEEEQQHIDRLTNLLAGQQAVEDTPKEVPKPSCSDL